MLTFFSVFKQLETESWLELAVHIASSCRGINLQLTVASKLFSASRKNPNLPHFLLMCLKVDELCQVLIFLVWLKYWNAHLDI